MGKLYVVGVGSGNYEDLTIKAYSVLKDSDFIFCDENLYKVLSRYLDVRRLVSNSYTATRERCFNAIYSAINNEVVSIVGSGDVGIYGISSIIIDITQEICPKLDVEMIPGITSFLSASSLLGSPLTKDFAVISLSDNFFEKEYSKKRIEAAAKNNFAIVFLSPCNPSNKNLIIAKKILLKYRNSDSLVGIVKHIGSINQQVMITSIEKIKLEDIDSNTTIIVGREDTILSYTIPKRLTTQLYHFSNV